MTKEETKGKKKYKKTIKDIPEHSRPREKLREKGAFALTDEEVVAAILGQKLSNLL